MEKFKSINDIIKLKSQSITYDIDNRDIKNIKKNLESINKWTVEALNIIWLMETKGNAV